MVGFYKNAITESCCQGLVLLCDQAFIQDFYLAGGTAIASRGIRRDFVDIYCMRDIISLEELFELAPKKYTDRPQFLAVAVRALVYFDDAEQQPMPRMLIPVEWEDIRVYCIEASRNLARRLGVLN